MRAKSRDWIVRKAPLYVWDEGIANPIDGSFTVVPEDPWGQEKRPTFRIAGAKCTPLQNRESFEFAAPVCFERPRVRRERYAAISEGCTCPARARFRSVWNGSTIKVDTGR